jgi:DNA processing protein
MNEGCGRRGTTPLPGLSDRELSGLLAPVTPTDDSASASGQSGDVALERFARAALTTAVEPGDLDAGRLVESLGAVGLVRAIVDGYDGDRVLELAGRDSETAEQDIADSPDGVGANEQSERGAAESRISQCLARWRPRLSLSESARAVERAARLGAQLLAPGDRFWPEGMSSLEEGAPLALWIRGDAERLGRLHRSIALVGARASSQYGEHVAMESAAGLADRGFAVVSGGAYGIDAAAHRATLLSGGLTVAFLAGGVDRLYPAGNSELLRRIAAEGVLAAELPPGSTPTRWRFLMRNRLIAAAANATIVVEAGRRSGSLNTAGHASQLGRPLGAVPGSILSPASAGCHRLIREYAATCVTTTEEMAELADPLGIGPDPGPPDLQPAASSGVPSDAERSVVTALSRAHGASADEIAARVQLPFAIVAAVLGRLDLAGRARERAGGWVLSEGSRA